MSFHHDASNPDARYLSLRGEVEKGQHETINDVPPRSAPLSLRTRGLSLDDRLLLESEGRKYLQAHYNCRGQPTVREWELLVTGWLACTKMREQIYPTTIKALGLLLEDSRNPNLDLILGRSIKVEAGTLTPIGKRRRLDEKRYMSSRRDSVLGDQAISGQINGSNDILHVRSLALAPEQPNRNGQRVLPEQLSTNRDVIDSLLALEEQNNTLREQVDQYKQLIVRLKVFIRDVHHEFRAVP